DKTMWNLFANGFVCSCLLVVVLSLYFTWQSVATGSLAVPHNFDTQTTETFRQLNPGSSLSWEYFSYIQLGDSIDVHPAYFSMYLIFCCVILVCSMLETERFSILKAGLVALFV